MNITIGEVKLKITDEALKARFNISVETIQNDIVAASGEDTNYALEWRPSRTAWDYFIKTVDLYDLFCSKDSCLMKDHTGVYPITQKHKEEIHNAYIRYKLRYPKAKATFEGNVENEMLFKLGWLKYRVDYALENCKIPAISIG